jgi:hypothetical protein
MTNSLTMNDLSTFTMKTVNGYKVLKNGKPCGITGSLEYVVDEIRKLESNLDRSREHSPFTIVLRK